MLSDFRFDQARSHRKLGCTVETHWAVLLQPLTTSSASCAARAIIALFLAERGHIVRDMDFHKIWMEQCRATHAIRKRFGVRSALAASRRCLRAPGAPPLSPVRSLYYFLPVIEEVLANPLPNGYLEYLKRKLKKIQAAHDAALLRGQAVKGR